MYKDLKNKNLIVLTSENSIYDFGELFEEVEKQNLNFTIFDREEKNLHPSKYKQFIFDIFNKILNGERIILYTWNNDILKEINYAICLNYVITKNNVDTSYIKENSNCSIKEYILSSVYKINYNSIIGFEKFNNEICIMNESDIDLCSKLLKTHEYNLEWMQNQIYWFLMTYDEN